MPAPTSRYTPTAIALHWLMALGLFGAIGMGWWASELPMSPLRLKAINWHKWGGVTLLLLALLRLAWRARHLPPPALPAPRWQAQAAAAVHGLLYALMLLVPLLGWSYSNAAGFPVVWFGVLPLPDFIGADKALAETLKGLHRVAAWTLLVLILAHVAAALKHHFIDKDALLARMKPGRSA